MQLEEVQQVETEVTSAKYIPRLVIRMTTTRTTHTVYDAICAAIRSLGDLDPVQTAQAALCRSLARKIDVNSTSTSGASCLAHARAVKDLAALLAALAGTGGVQDATDLFRSILMDQS